MESVPMGTMRMYLETDSSSKRVMRRLHARQRHMQSSFLALLVSGAHGLGDEPEGEEGEDATEHSSGILNDDGDFDTAAGLAAREREYEQMVADGVIAPAQGPTRQSACSTAGCCIRGSDGCSMRMKGAYGNQWQVMSE